jgi:hypothetical protein
MRLHLDNAQRESRLCLAAVIAIMVLTGSAILIYGNNVKLMWNLKRARSRDFTSPRI